MFLYWRSITGSLEQYTGAGGLWVQTNYNNCPQMRFNFRDNNCQTRLELLIINILFRQSNAYQNWL